jgi:hypothetical protein
LLLTVVGLAGTSGLVAYGLSGDRILLDWAALWGAPWSIWVWPFNPYTDSSFVGDAAASVLVNVLLVAAVLWWVWTKTRCIVMNMLIPLRWLAGCAVGVGILAAGMWGMVGLVLLSLQDLD